MLWKGTFRVCCDYLARIIFLQDKKPQPLTFPIPGIPLLLREVAQGEVTEKVLPTRAILQSRGGDGANAAEHGSTVVLVLGFFFSSFQKNSFSKVTFLFWRDKVKNKQSREAEGAAYV